MPRPAYRPLYRHGARPAALLLLALALRLAPAAADPHAAIFLYHRFDEPRTPSTSIPSAAFEAQLEWLAQNGYSVVPLERVLQALRGEASLPAHSVALTVDDAFRSVYEVAWPRLKARGWPLSVFVSTDAVDAGERAYMSWAQMRELAAQGVRFANHSASHDHLVQRRAGETAAQWRARVAADIDRAQRRLREELGAAPPWLAYPYGEYDHALAALVRARGYTAFGQQSGPVGPLSDPRALPRFPVAGAYAALDGFAAKAAMRPLPVREYTPWDPFTRDTRPRLEVRLAPAPLRLEELACYVSGQGRTPVEWLEPGVRFAVRAREPLPAGRSRYNCTAPDAGHRHWYWFSQQWLVAPEAPRPERAGAARPAGSR